MPIGVNRAKAGGGRRVGRQAKLVNRRCTPSRPMPCLAGRTDEPPQPTHRASRSGSAIITGAANHRNRHDSDDFPPAAPLVKIWHGVGAHQPDEFVAGIAAQKRAQRVDRVARAGAHLEIAGPDRCPPCHSPGRRQPRCEGRHVLCVGLERIAGRHQPPHLIEAKSVERGQADAPMPAMRRIEGTAEEADARHRVCASMAARCGIMSRLGGGGCLTWKRLGTL